MTLFHNLETNIHGLDYIQFNITEVDTSFANALRRIMLAEIPSIAMDEKYIIFHRNMTSVHNDYIGHRIGFVPLRIDDLDNYQDGSIILELNVKNQEDHTINVTAGDLRLKEAPEGTDLLNLIPLPKTIITKLKKDEELRFEAKVTKGIANHHDRWNVSSCATYQFQQDPKEIKKVLEKLEKDTGHKVTKEVRDRFMVSEAGRYYKIDKNGNPEVFQFKIENIGVGCMPPEVIFGKAIEVLENKLITLKTAFEKNNLDKVYLEQAKTEMEATDFVIIGENSTLGHLIKTDIYYNGGVDYVGSYVPHILEGKMVIRIAAKKNVENVFLNSLDNLIELCQKVGKQWNKFINKSL